MKLVAINYSWLEEALKASKAALETSLWRHEKAFDRELFRHALANGKRFRPILTLTITKALGGDEKKALDYGVAVELAHAASLIHDDILDGDMSRRGRASFWVEHDLGNGVLFPHELISHSLSLLGKHGFEEVALLYGTWGKMARGARRDFVVERISMGEYYSKIRLKTASLFSAACQLGAMAAGRRELRGRFHRYGMELGMGFQIADDVVDVVRTVTTGEPVGDMRAGSLSLPLVLLWLRSPRHREQIQELLTRRINGNVSLSLAEEINKKILKDCLEVSWGHVYKAQRIIEELILGEESRKILLDLPEYAVQRMLGEAL